MFEYVLSQCGVVVNMWKKKKRNNDEDWKEINFHYTCQQFLVLLSLAPLAATL